MEERANKAAAYHRVYSASSSRDTDSAKAFIEGMFPERVLGKKPGVRLSNPLLGLV
jgi:hypothetical protein